MLIYWDRMVAYGILYLYFNTPLSKSPVASYFR